MAVLPYRVFVIPSSAAREFILSMKPSNDPAELTARTMAASFALSTISVRHKSRIDIDSPTLMPIQLASQRLTSGVATAIESRSYFPA